ncbi:hypothetical protein JCM9279_007178 [Rhodotorula babjevae]
MSYRKRLDPRDSSGHPLAGVLSSGSDGKPRQDSDTIPPKLFAPLPPIPQQPKPKEGNSDKKRLDGESYRSLGSSANRSRYRGSYGQQSRFGADSGFNLGYEGGYRTSRALSSDGNGDPVPSSPTIPPQYPQPKRTRLMRSLGQQQRGQSGAESGSDSSDETVAAHGRSSRSLGGLARSVSGLGRLGESSSSSSTMRSLARGAEHEQAQRQRQRRRERAEVGCSSDTDNE